MCINRSLLAKIRIEKGFTQEQLAFESGVDIANINRLESGKYTSPGFCTIIKLCNVLDIDMNVLRSDSCKAF